eukprot:2622320-Rhodomonas_salina.1
MNARDKKRKSYSLGLDPAAKPTKNVAKDIENSASINNDVVSMDGAASAQVLHGVYGVYEKRNDAPTVD